MKVPELIQNIYRDLRDRRMLSIAIALVMAIIAVPFLLGGSGEDEGDSTLPPAVAQAPFEGDEQLDPVVLAETPGLRDFRERLADYRSHNPFKRNLTEEERRALRAATGGGGAGNGGGSGSTGDTSDQAGTDTGSIDIPSDIGGVDTGSTDTGSTDTGSTDTGPTDDGSTDTGTDTDTGANGGLQLISYRVDVRIGPVGKTKVIEDVPQLTFLPERKHPLVQFIDADLNGNKVAFIVNPTAESLRGDAKCIRSRQDCQYLMMEPKQEMYFDFDGSQYRIQLMEIIEHREPYEPQGKSDSGDDDGGSAGRSLSALLGG